MSSAVTIGIDARKIRDFGIGRYLEGLLSGLAENEGDERYVLFAASLDRTLLPGRLPSLLSPRRFRLVECRAPLYSLRELTAFRGVGRREGLDLLHFPHYVRGLFPGCRVGVTIHDAIHLSHPPSLAARIYATVVLGWAARSADVRFADTAAARDDIASRVGVRPERFRVVPLAAGPGFVPPAPEALERFRRERGLDREFVLVTASHRPYKNLAGAIAGFERAALPDAALVVPARDAASAARLAPFARPGMRVLHPVTDDELPRLYASARVVLAPSLAEGFGLPPLEALATGAVVLASDIGPHQEVLADAARFVDARSPADIARELTALWSEGTLRAELSERGPLRAARFSWRRTAELTLAGWRDAIGAR